MKCPKWFRGIVVASVFAGSAQADEGVCRLKGHIDMAVRTIGEKSDSGGTDGLVDTWPFLYWEPEIEALRKEVSESWRLVLDNFGELATDDARKTIVLFSCWEVREKEYAAFLEEVAKLAEEGKVPPQLLRCCLNPCEGPLAGYLQRHGTDTVVQEVEGKCQRLAGGETRRGNMAEQSGSRLPETDAEPISVEKGPECIPRRKMAVSMAVAVLLGLGGIWLWHCRRKE